MSLETAAATVAEQIRRQEFVEVFAHHDADGIAAASILCHAMLRAGIRFRLRVRQDVTPADLAGDGAFLLCDLGSGIEDLPKDTMVIDHHLPKFDGGFHANPRLENIDGEYELSTAGTAYLVALYMGDNRDLAGLVIPGIIGDGQQIAGKNLEIFNDGIANGIIVPGRGVTLPGRDMPEQWYMATRPFLDGISGDTQVIADLTGQAQDDVKGENRIRLDTLISGVVLKAAKNTSLAGLQAVYGDTFHLQREVIEDAHALAAVIDACGKAGHGDIGATLCLRSSHYLGQAWEITRQHRMSVIEAIRILNAVEDAKGVYEVSNPALTGDVADILSRDRPGAVPVLVYAKAKDACRISARCPAGTGTQLGSLIRGIAIVCGGTGGGHSTRAGATVPCDKIGIFTRSWQEALAS
jgi:hypothetical protein